MRESVVLSSSLTLCSCSGLPTKKSKSSSNRRKENATVTSNPSSATSKPSVASEFVVPPKPPLSTASKFQADFQPLTIPRLTNNESSSCPPFLSAKIQSASFTAGTFGSITANESASTSSSKSTRLSINLARKSGGLSTACAELD